MNKDVLSILGKPFDSELLFIKTISKLENKCPEFVLYEYADLLVRTNRIKNAIELFEKCNLINPYRRESLFKLGTCYFLNKDFQKAKDIFIKCVQTFSSYSEANLFLGITYWALKDTNNSIKELTKASESNLVQTKDLAIKSISAIKEGKSFLSNQELDQAILKTSNLIDIIKNFLANIDLKKDSGKKNEPAKQ
jgi:tetratricopeptide (TPR) repeat protein